MRRCYIYLAVLVSIMTAPVASLAGEAADSATTNAPSGNRDHAAQHRGFYVDLPKVTYHQLIGLIRAYQASLGDRKEEIARYLDVNRLGARDALITAIMPGGLIYAAVRKGKLEEARAELAQVTEDMHELSRDLLVMQAGAGELKMARLQ